MGKNKVKFYAVKNGRTPGIYNTWDECKEQVNGYSNAVFKSFETKEDAIAYLNNERKPIVYMEIEKSAEKTETPSKDIKKKGKRTQKEAKELTCIEEQLSLYDKAENNVGENLPGPDVPIAYVDGSYNIKTQTYGSGVIILYKGEEIRMSCSGNNTELATMRNVAGEIKAAEMVFDWALENRIKEVHIYYDYKGIAAWCNSTWKTNKDGTQAFRAHFLEVSKVVKIVFHKVKGHSGDTYNDIADSIAKEASGVSS